jgi:DNA-binding NtrC family response regulator
MLRFYLKMPGDVTSEVQMARVLVVDDSPETCDLLELLLGQVGGGGKMAVSKATTPDEAIRLLEGGRFDLMLSDVNLEADRDGLDLLRVAKPLGVETILLTGFGTVERALEAVREGAFDFVSKPWNNEELKTLVSRALQLRRPEGRAKAGGVGLRADSAMVGSSPKMMEVYRTIASLQKSRSTVLITGESGTGKELVARTIYQSSDRKEGPFVAVNCGSLTESLLESEIFGHAKGAFTGAASDKKGLFEEAHGGTIFLDEIGETSPNFQVRLLRVLQDGEIRRVGGNRALRVDVRVIAATNKDLLRLVQDGKFREDLYYRLNVVEIRMPPVRERRTFDEGSQKVISDVPPLIEFFLEEASKRDGRQYRMRADALETLSEYSWPGNVREMANVLEYVTQLSRGRQITPEDLPEKIRGADKRGAAGPPAVPPAALTMTGEPHELVKLPELTELVDGWAALPTLEELERRYIQVLLKRGPKKSRLAETLGIDRTTLYRRLRELGLEDAPRSGAK